MLEHVVDHIFLDDSWSDATVDIAALEPELSVWDAYAVQFAQMSRRVESGDRIVGYKAANTSAGALQVLGPDFPVPTIGTLLASRLAQDGDEFGLRPGTTFVEAEIAAVLSSRLEGPDVTHLDVRRAVGWLCPAIELAAWSPRVVAGKQSPQHAIATSKTNGVVVVGEPVPADAVPDLRLEGAMLEIDGSIVGTGTGAEAMGHPFRVVAAIARQLAQHDLALEAGMVVMTGSLMAPHVLPDGSSSALASFTRLGRVSVRFDGTGTGSGEEG